MEALIKYPGIDADLDVRAGRFAAGSAKTLLVLAKPVEKSPKRRLWPSGRQP